MHNFFYTNSVYMTFPPLIILCLYAHTRASLLTSHVLMPATSSTVASFPPTLLGAHVDKRVKTWVL